jgi:hypothetical protein
MYNERTPAVCETGWRSNHPPVIRGNTAMADAQLSTISVRRCLKCGTDISHRHGVAKFCSEKCHDIFHGRHQEPVGKCQYCSKDISHLHGGKKYCSNVCLKKARTVRHGGTPRARLEPRTRPIVDGQLQCVRCDQWKSVEDFTKSKSSPRGIEQTCKRCVADDSKVRMTESRKRNPEIHRERSRISNLKIRQKRAAMEGREYKFREDILLTV